MTQETMMTDQPTTITEAPASTEAGQVATEAQATATQPAQEQQQQQGDGQQTEVKAEDQVPEQYADFAFEEGKALDADMSEGVKNVAKDLGLTQAQAQKLAEIVRFDIESKNSAVATQREEWRNAVRADPQIGGPSMNENLAAAKKAFNQFGTPELVGLLETTGYMDHPAVVRFGLSVGKATSEDRVLRGGAAGQPTDPAKRLFPNQA
jgi:hypothetical protein